MQELLNTVATYFANAKAAERDMVVDYVAGMLAKYKSAGLLSHQFVVDFATGGEEHMHQRFSELYFGCWLIDQGLSVTSGDPGPDFRVIVGTSPVWIEVICPTAGAGKNEIPTPTYENWGNGMTGAVYNAPTRETLLRWTTAIDAKCKAFTTYLEKGIVKAGDRCIVAINACRLGNTGFEGISQQPYLCEAVFAVGPQQITINLKTNKAAPAELTYKPAIQNFNNSSISTDVFLNGKSAHLSAVIATSQHVSSCVPLVYRRPIIVAHNSLAAAPLNKKEFAAEVEYWVEIDEDDSSYTLRHTQK